MGRLAPRLILLLLIVLATAGMVLQNGSVPHVHAAAHAGLFNEEHDLTLLAGLAGHVVLAQTAPALSFDAPSRDVVVFVPERQVLRPASSDASRAPPTR
jgi:hypothetical protein